MAKAQVKSTKIHDTTGDKILNGITIAILIFVIIVVGYPVIYVISCSFSSSRALEIGSVILWPVDFSLEAYKFVLAYKDVWVGFRNSLLYCAFDVVFQLFCSTMMAYAMSRNYFHCNKFYTMFFFLTTRVGAGLIPVFILKCNMGLFDNVWAVLIAGKISIGDMLILRTAVRHNIPNDLLDAAMMDGANHFQTMVQLVMPLVKATLAVLALYALVGQWNEYFTSMIYLRDKRYYPLQLVLRPIMTAATAVSAMDTGEMQSLYQQQANQGLENVRYALILISTIPCLVLYFCLQKYFKGGVMAGSWKG